jgi:hypothetical protein
MLLYPYGNTFKLSYIEHKKRNRTDGRKTTSLPPIPESYLMYQFMSAYAININNLTIVSRKRIFEAKPLDQDMMRKRQRRLICSRLLSLGSYNPFRKKCKIAFIKGTSRKG